MFVFFFFKQKTAYEIRLSLVGSEMCIETGCYREICEAGEAVCVKDLAIGGRELIQMGMTPGPAIGEMLQQLLEHVLAHPEENEKEKLLFLAKEWKK